MIVVAPAWVTLTTASIKDLVPLANLSNSKTPGGLKKKSFITD